MSRSWSSAHDWKSCRGQKLLESSNLSISATSLRTTYRSQRLFAKVTSHSFCRSSSPNRTRLRWASIRFFITALGIFLLTFPMPEQSPLCFDAFLYLRLKIRLASLPCFSFLRRIPRMCLGGLFKLRIACDDVFSFRTIVIAHSLRCSSFQNRTRLRWASILFLSCLGIFLAKVSHATADDMSFAADFCVSTNFVSLAMAFFFFGRRPTARGAKRPGQTCVCPGRYHAVTGEGCSRSRRSCWGCSG